MPLEYTPLQLPGDLKITVPASAKYMTTYILQEQKDWFERELNFIRRFVKPGMQIVDIGANYGIYALTMAKLIGSTGKVWAFEPTQTVADCLRNSIQDNELSNIELIQAGLSNRLGPATFYTGLNAELNSLSKIDNPQAQMETIELLTLDHCLAKYGWKQLDFIKLDAEGEELNILEAGNKLLTHLSPIIMFELKHGGNLNLPLIEQFKIKGYTCYRLIPSLNILMPFDSTLPYDGLLLNLFCCKIDKAIQLEKAGLLVQTWQPKIPTNIATDVLLNQLGFEHYFPKLTSESAAYKSIVNGYLLSCSTTETAANRVGYLMGALAQQQGIQEKEIQSIEYLSTFARICYAAGERRAGNRMLLFLIKKYVKQLNFELEELLLPPCEGYDQINPNDSWKAWLMAAIIEKYIKEHAYSTYFSKKHTLPLFRKLWKLGFLSKPMEARYSLAYKMYGNN